MVDSYQEFESILEKFEASTLSSFITANKYKSKQSSCKKSVEQEFLTKCTGMKLA